MLSRNVERFRGVLVLKAHRSLYHSTLGLQVIKKKKKKKEKGRGRESIIAVRRGQTTRVGVARTARQRRGVGVVRVGGDDGELLPWH